MTRCTDKIRANAASFRVVIIGGGLAGLTAAIALKQVGHDVTVLERMPAFREVGAGIQLAPNATRLLRRWVLLDEVRKYAFQPESISNRSYRGRVLSKLPSTTIIEWIYRVPYLVIHRADLLKVLVTAASARGIAIHLGCEVTDIDFSKPSVKISTGEVYEGDVVFGADGDRSACRSALLGYPDLPVSTGDIVFRIAIQRPDITEKQAAWQLMKRESVNLWLGPDAHAVSYLLRNKVLNVVLVHHDHSGNEVMYGAQPANLGDLRMRFSGWDPMLQELMDVEDSNCSKWTMTHVRELASWRHESGRFALIGDAAHAMLPSLAQGAAQAFEDAGVLGGIFGSLADIDQIGDALAVFEKVRIPRTQSIREKVLEQHAMYSLRDGPEQQRRDARMAWGPIPGSPHFMTDPLFQWWLWGYDATADADSAWNDFLGMSSIVSGRTKGAVLMAFIVVLALYRLYTN